MRSGHLEEFPGSPPWIAPGDPELTLLDLPGPGRGLVVPSAARQGQPLPRVDCGAAGDHGGTRSPVMRYRD